VEFFVKLKAIRERKGHSVIYKISDSTKYGRWLKKSHQNFCVKNIIFFLKKVIGKFGPRNFFPSVPPKLGARSPPMKQGVKVLKFRFQVPIPIAVNELALSLCNF